MSASGLVVLKKFNRVLLLTLCCCLVQYAVFFFASIYDQPSILGLANSSLDALPPLPVSSFDVYAIVDLIWVMDGFLWLGLCLIHSKGLTDGGQTAKNIEG